MHSSVLLPAYLYSDRFLDMWLSLVALLYLSLYAYSPLQERKCVDKPFCGKYVEFLIDHKYRLDIWLEAVNRDGETLFLAKCQDVRSIREDKTINAIVDVRIIKMTKLHQGNLVIYPECVLTSCVIYVNQDMAETMFVFIFI